MTNETNNVHPHTAALDQIRKTIGPSENTVGTTIELSLTGFNGDNPIAAKVDTGAQSSSLHAKDMDVTTNEVTQGSTVKFKFGQYNYDMDVEGFQAVSSADGGTVQRPMVKFNVRIKDQVYPEVVFNLSDRGHMDFPILVGLNLIKQAKLVVDPSISEMMLSFGQEGFKPVSDENEEVEGDPTGNPDVDKSVENPDNTGNQQPEQCFATWYENNKSKTVAEVFAELFSKPEATPVVNNDPTE